MPGEPRPQGLPPPLVRYVAVCIVLGVVAGALAFHALLLTPPTLGAWALAGVAALFVASFVLEAVPPTLLIGGRRIAIHPDEALFVVALATLPPPLVPLVSAVAVWGAQIVRKKPAHKIAFNVALHLLAVGSATGVCLLLGGWGIPAAQAVLSVPLVTSSVNHVFMAMLLNRVGNAPVRHEMARQLVTSVLTSSVVGATVGYIALLVHGVHPLALVALAPLGALAYRAMVATYHHENELATRRALNRITETLLTNPTEDVIVKEAMDACESVFSPFVVRVTLSAAAGKAPREWERHKEDVGRAPTRSVTEAIRDVRGTRVGSLEIVLPWMPKPQWRLDHELVTLVARWLGLALVVNRSLRSLHESEQRLRDVLNGVKSPLFVVSANGDVVFQNARARVAFDTPRVPFPLDGILLHLDPASGDTLAKHLEVDAADDADLELVTRGDPETQHVFEVSVSPMGLQGTEPGRLVVAHDITVRRRLERAAEARREATMRAERLAGLGVLVAGVAHEINNPLMYMIGNLDLTLADIDALEDATGDAPPPDLSDMRRRVTTARGGAERIGRIAKALKVLSRNEATGARGRVDLARVVREVRDLVQVGMRTRVDVRFTLPDAPVVVTGIESELHQCVLNLVKNAVEAFRNAPGHVHVACRTEAGNAVVTIADDGPGIPPDVRARLFTPFFTTKADGTGLGLTLVHTFVKNHGGELTLESESGRGTTFTITLPLARTGVEPAPVPVGRPGGLRLKPLRTTSASPERSDPAQAP